MKKILATTIASLLLLAATAEAKKQVILNGSFEQAAGSPLLPLDWVAFSDPVQSTDFAWDGTHSALITLRNNAFVGLYQDIGDAESGVRIKVQAQMYVPSSAPLTGDDAAGIKLEFSPPAGTNQPPPEENLAFDQTAPLDTWVPVTLNTVVPQDATLAKITLISFEDDVITNGSVYADVASAVFGSQPAVNQLQNPSFESGSSGPNGLTNWNEFADPASGTRKNTFEVPAVDGLSVAKFIGATTGIFQQIPVTFVGDTLSISCNFRQRSTNPYSNAHARAGVKVEWVAGTVPTPNIDVVPNSNPISGTTNIIPLSSTNVWVPVYIDYTLPPTTAAGLRCTAISAFGPGNSDPYFDAFEAVLMNVFNGADSDGDDDEDLIDMANLQRAFTGSGGGMKFGGLVFDNDEDNDVDSADWVYARPRMTGPAN